MEAEPLAPWEDCDVTTEITPVPATAAAIVHRLIRLIRASPVSRALTLAWRI